MKFLIVKMSALGDVVQSLPVAVAIKSQLPGAQVDWIVEKPSAPLLRDHPALDRVLVSPRHDMFGENGKLISPVRQFIHQLRQVRYDVVLDLHQLMKSAIFVALSRGACKVGWRGGKEPLAALPLSERLPPYDIERHALDRYLDILEPLGLMRPARPDYGLAPDEPAQQAAQRLEAEVPGQGPLVLLHPVAKWESKLWPLAHWVELARGLVGQGVRLALTGAPEDREVTGAIAGTLAGEVLDLAGRTDLPQLAALITRARIMVCTDTGVMHLAAAMGTPVVALFGPTAPWRTGPYGPGHTVLRLGLPCSPCFQRQCGNPRCLEELTPDMVLEAAVSALEKSAASTTAGE